MPVKRLNKHGLTPKQERFCQEYVVDLNATEAAYRAGFKGTSAKVTASRLLIFPPAQARIQGLMNERSKRTDIKADDVLRELYLLAKVDIGEAFDAEGNVRPIKEIPEAVRRAISGVEVSRLFTEGVDIGEKTKLKFWDKPKCLEILARHLKLLTQTVEHSGSITLADLVAGSREEK